MFFLGNMHYESTILLTSVYGNIICESIRIPIDSVQICSVEVYYITYLSERIMSASS